MFCVLVYCTLTNLNCLDLHNIALHCFCFQACLGLFCHVFSWFALAGHVSSSLDSVRQAEFFVCLDLSYVVLSRLVWSLVDVCLVYLLLVLFWLVLHCLMWSGLSSA